MATMCQSTVRWEVQITGEPAEMTQVVLLIDAAFHICQLWKSYVYNRNENDQFGPLVQSQCNSISAWTNIGYIKLEKVHTHQLLQVLRTLWSH